MRIFLMFLLLISSFSTHATPGTERIGLFSNNRVSVWKTIIYPSSKQALKMHRHDFDRVVVALTDGLLKVTTSKGKTHYMQFKKDKAYYLSKDIPGEIHTDENIGKRPIKVIVIELHDKGKKTVALLPKSKTSQSQPHFVYV